MRHMKTIERSGELVSATRITVPPEHRRELCLTISSLLERIRRENGCRAYLFYGEVEDQNSLMLISEWETPTAWENHLNSANFAVLLGSLRLLSDRSNLDFSMLSHVAGIEARTKAKCEPTEQAQSPLNIE